LTSIFNFFAYITLGVVFLLAIGIFAYGRILASNQSAKDAELAQAEKTIDSEAAENFVRLRNRLTSGQELLTNHTAFSGFFTLLETLIPSNTRFLSLHLSVDSTGTVKLEGSGTAKNFNALAAASTAFAKDGRIKDAIFSDIVVNPKNNSVSFALSAYLDRELIAFSPKSRVAAPRITTPVATSTATSTP
jgi:hypothetical protein